MSTAGREGGRGWRPRCRCGSWIAHSLPSDGTCLSIEATTVLRVAGQHYAMMFMGPSHSFAFRKRSEHKVGKGS